MNYLFLSRHNKRAMTLIEVLIAVSLVTLISIAIYNSLSNGVKIWQRSQRLVIEEDINIFFDKLSQDIRNSFPYSKIKFEGNETSLSFPTMVHTLADARIGLSPNEYVEQIGKVEYYFDLTDRGLYRRQANYSQAIYETYQPAIKIIPAIENIKFSYFYQTDKGEEISREALATLPAGIEVKIEFSDKQGRRTMSKFIHVPTNS